MCGEEKAFVAERSIGKVKRVWLETKELVGGKAGVRQNLQNLKGMLTNLPALRNYVGVLSNGEMIRFVIFKDPHESIVENKIRQ